MRGDYLFGSQPTVAGFSLFVTLLWAATFGVRIPERLAALRERMLARPSVQAAMVVEGLTQPLSNDATRVAVKRQSLPASHNAALRT